MNDRINELFDTALDAVIPNTWTNLNMDQLNDIKNKFAELIVKECADICEKDGRWWADQGYLMEAGEAGSLATQIKEHFGVK